MYEMPKHPELRHGHVNGYPSLKSAVASLIQINFPMAFGVHSDILRTREWQ
jgi:hypothetical protein